MAEKLPVSPTLPSYEIIHSVLAEACVKNVAQEGGLSQSTIYKWGVLPEDKKNQNPLDKVVLLMRHDPKKRILQWLCQLHECAFDPAPGKLPKKHLPAKTIVSELLDFMKGLIVIEKGQREAARRLRKKWVALRDQVDALLIRLEQS